MSKIYPKNLDKALDELRRSEKELVRLTVDLIRFRSENPPLQDYDVQLYIRDFLGEAGLKSELHDPGDKAWALTSSFGEGDGGFIFYGHADVVPAGDPSRWSHPPFSGEIVGDRIYGRGAGDMKAGLAAELYAYRLLYQCEVELRGRAEFVSVLDEENWHRSPIGWNTSDWLLASGKLRGKACVMGEQSGIKKICLGERGDYWVRLQVKAQPRHGSAPIYDDNACIRLFRALERIRQAIEPLQAEPPADIRAVVYASPKHIAEDLGEAASNIPPETLLGFLVKPTMNVGVVRGGTMINVVPDSCEAEVAFCVPIGMSIEQLHSVVSRTVGEVRGVTLELLGESQSNPSYTRPDAPIARTLKEEATQVLGVTPEFYVTQGTSDANIFRKHGVDTCFYGPGDFANTHGYNESVSIDALTKAAQIHLRAAARLLA